MQMTSQHYRLVSLLAEVSAVTTDYRFRGLTQTQNDPAVQAGFTLAHDSGFLYLGLWGSNVDFGEGSPSLDSSIHLLVLQQHQKALPTNQYLMWVSCTSILQVQMI